MTSESVMVESSEWFYLRIWTDEKVFNEDPLILGRCTTDPDYLPVATEERIFFKVRHRPLAERLVRLFEKGVKAKHEENGSTKLRIEFSLAPVSDFDSDEQFLIEEELSRVDGCVEAGTIDRAYPLSSECLADQAMRWIGRLDPETGEDVAKRTIPDPQQLRQSLPTAIIAAMGVRDLARMCYYYPTAMPSNDAERIHTELLTAFELFYKGTGLPDLSEIYTRPKFGDPKTDAMMTAVVVVALMNHPDCTISDGGDDEMKQRMDAVVQDCQVKCRSPVKELVERVMEVMLMDCRIPNPPDDPVFKEPKRFLQMLRLYWQPCREMVLSEMNSHIGTRPHRLLPLIVNLRDRITQCGDALGEVDGIAVAVQKITGLLDILLEGEVDDLSAVPEWTVQESQSVDNTIERLRLQLGSGS